MKIFPIVHIIDSDINFAVRRAKWALESGADGVYLVDRQNGDYYKKPIYETFNNLYDELNEEKYIGINISGVDSLSAMNSLKFALEKRKKLIAPPSGLWVDSMRGVVDKTAAIELRNSDSRLQSTRLLGGIAYKNAGEFNNILDMAAYETTWLEGTVDTVVTNGAALSGATVIEKLQLMRKILGDKTLAIEGSVSAEMLNHYDCVVDEIMVPFGVVNRPTTCGVDHGQIDKFDVLVEKAHMCVPTIRKQNTLNL